MCACLSVCATMCAQLSTCRGQKRVWGPLELELEVVVCHLMRVLGLNPGPLQTKQVLFITVLSLHLS